MIFRRRRTRIEIEHTTLTVMGGGLNSVIPRPAGVTPAAPSPVESVLARLLAFPEPTEPNAIPSATPTANPSAKETRP